MRTRKLKVEEDSIEKVEKLKLYTANLKGYVYLNDNLSEKKGNPTPYIEGKKYHINDFLFLMVVNGEINLSVDNVQYCIKPRCGLIIYANTLVQFAKLQHDTKYICIRFTQAAREESFNDLSLYKNKAEQCSARFVQYTIDQELWMYNYYKEFCHGISTSTQKMPREFARAMNNQLHIFNINTFNVDSAIKGDIVSRKENLYRQYLDLLNEHAKTEREVQWYADKMNISPKYLSTLCVTYSGMNASQLIGNYVVKIVVDMMKMKKMKMMDIATALNFPSQSFFGRYFKRVTGQSPKQYSMDLINK